MMANALAMMMPPTGLPGVDPTRQPPMPGMSTSTAVAPAPMQAPRQNALATPMTANFNPPKPKQQNMLLSSAVNGFQRGLDPKGWQAGQDQAKADKAEGVKKQIAMLQNIRALPMEQRMQALPQISQSIGKQIPPELMQDQAIDTHLAMLMGEAGMAPSTPEPMSEYQRAQIALEEQKMQQPKPSDYDYREIDGPEGPGTYAVNKADPSQMQFVGKAVPKLDPANYDTVTMADGVWAVNKRNPNDKIRIGAAPPKAGSGSDTAGTTKDPEFIRLEREYAKDWDRIQKDFSEVNTQYRRVKALGNLAATDKPARSAADLALVVTITKMLDPTSVAREGEVQLTASSASLVDQATNLLNQWQNGQTILPDATRQSLLKMADTIFPSYSDAYENRKRDAYTTANEYGFSPKRTMMGADISEFDNMSDEEVQSIFDGIEQAAASPTGSGAVPTEAAAELMRDPSPEARAEFDDAFGPGMAQRVLNGSR